MKVERVLRQAASVPTRGLIETRRAVRVVVDCRVRYVVVRVPSWRRDVRGLMTITASTATAAARARARLRRDPAWLDFLDDADVHWPGEVRVPRRRRAGV